MSNEIFDTYGNDPVALCKEWLAQAAKSELNDPEAACLSTSSKDNAPSGRMVLIKDIAPEGFKFHTNENSHKGRDMAENPQASLCFYWKSTRKQIRVEGTVEQIPENEADAYFSTRPTERQIGAWASSQSQPFANRAELENAVQKYETEFAGKPVPRPPYWKGYRLKPRSIEFWIGHEARLHTRFVYKKQNDGTWAATWLCP